MINAPRETEFLLYQTDEGHTRVEVRFDGETAWLSLGQMTELFQRDKSVISRHIKNVFEEGELDRNSVVAEYATTAADGKTYHVEYITATRVSHDDAVAKAELEYDRFASARAALPAPVESHFEQALRDLKLLEKTRPGQPKAEAQPKGKKRP